MVSDIGGVGLSLATPSTTIIIITLEIHCFPLDSHHWPLLGRHFTPEITMATVHQRSSILSTPAGRTGCEKLTTLTLNTVWGENVWGADGQCDCSLMQFVDESPENEWLETLVPSDYSFAKVQSWMVRIFQYAQSRHTISLCQFDIKVTYELESQRDWVHMLTDIAAGICSVLPYSFLYLVIRPRGIPIPILIRFANSDVDAVANARSASEGSVEFIRRTQTPIEEHILTTAADDEASSTSSKSIVTPETSSASGSDPGSPIQRPSSAASSLDKTEEEFNLAELGQGEYHVGEACDDDYGAVDDRTVDTYVGSFNSGNTAEEWEECLRFFSITRPANSKNTRVPIKKLPGMSVGLFDYQLMGVFNLLKLALQGVRGGFLADEQGLGKTQEMFGLIALTFGLRRSKADVLLAQSSPKPTRHNRRGSDARKCFADVRYGFRCYCYHEPTQQLADLLPDGPSIIIVPNRNMTQTLREAKVKLDTSTLKIRLQRGAVNDRLTASEAKSLSASITAKELLGGGSILPPVEYCYKSKGDASDFVIITTPDSLDHLVNVRFGTDVKVSNTTRRVKKGALLPGLVLMDEFHEYMQSDSIDGANIVAWLQDLRTACRGSQQPAPLAYLVSGTPFGESPSDIRPALSLLSQGSWETDAHPMADVTPASLDVVTAAYHTLAASQAEGTVLDSRDITDYRRRLGVILKHTMVRRLGTDSFLGKPLTNLGPLTVNIVDHSIPDHLINNLQSLADATHALAEQEAAAAGVLIPHLLRSNLGQSILLKLRLASTFPGIASPHPNGETFHFNLPEILSEITTAAGDVTKTRYFPHIPRWAAHSPKLATLDATVATMVADKTRIPGEACHAKKLVVFAPLEAEALLLFAYLLHRKVKGGDGLVKPVWLHSGMGQGERQGVIDKFLELNNAAPNVLVVPIGLAGTGLNFQRARYSVVTGPAWTKRECQQAYYRTHRIGQKMETRLQLWTGRWNPAERIVLGRHAGREVEEGDLRVMGNGVGAEVEGGLAERHQGVGNESE